MYIRTWRPKTFFKFYTANYVISKAVPERKVFKIYRGQKTISFTEMLKNKAFMTWSAFLVQRTKSIFVIDQPLNAQDRTPVY